MAGSAVRKHRPVRLNRLEKKEKIRDYILQSIYSLCCKYSDKEYKCFVTSFLQIFIVSIRTSYMCIAIQFMDYACVFIYFIMCKPYPRMNDCFLWTKRRLFWNIIKALSDTDFGACEVIFYYFKSL